MDLLIIFLGLFLTFAGVPLSIYYWPDALDEAVKLEAKCMEQGTSPTAFRRDFTRGYKPYWSVVTPGKQVDLTSWQEKTLEKAYKRGLGREILGKIINHVTEL